VEPVEEEGDKDEEKEEAAPPEAEPLGGPHA
jgi:hypothetical protein